MAVVKNLMVRAGADFSAITKQASKAKASMKGMESSVSKSCSRMTVAASGMKKAFAALGAAVSVTALVSAAKSAKAAYDEQAEASAKLAQVMQNTMGATSKQVQAIEDYIDAQERLGVVTGDVQTAGAQELATYLTMTSSLKKLIPVMNDMVAQQYGIGASAESAVSIATMLGKVMNGQTSALSRYGYTFDAAQEAVLKYGTEAQRAAVLAEVVGESVGGMNEALAATPNGRLQQVSNTLGKIQESFGLAVNSVLVLFIPALNTLCGVLSNVATLANKVAQTLANVFGGAPPGASKTVQYTGAMADSVGEVEEAAVSASKAMSNLMGFDQINKLTSSSSGGVSAVEPSAGGSITETVDVDTSEAGESIGWLEEKLQGLQAKFAAIDTSKLTGALDRLKASAAPLKDTFFSGLSWALDNVFAPLATWSTEGFLPAFLDTLGGAASVLSSGIDALKPGASWLWENFLQPIASWTGDQFVTALQETADLLHDLADLLSGNTSFGEFISNLTPAQSAMVGIAAALGTIAAISAGMTGLTAITTFVKSLQGLNAVGTIGKLAEVFMLTASGAGTLSEAMSAVFGPKSIIAGIAGVIAGAVIAVTNFISMLKNGFSWAQEALMLLGTALATVGAIILGAPALVAGVIAAIVAAVATAVVVIKDHWTQIKEFGSAAWEGIKSSWSNASSWFSSTVIQPISNGFKGFANGIIGYFEGVVNGGISGVNKLIESFNGLSFSAPDWVPIIGGKSFSLNLKTMPTISLPRLAAGAVIRPNNEFAAILGDQTSGMNIETPERLLRDIIRQENDSTAVLNMLAKILQAINDGKVMVIDRKTVGKIMRSEFSNAARSGGTDLIPLGGG